MFRKNYAIFSLAAVLLAVSAFAQDNTKEKEKEKNKAAAPSVFQTPDVAPLTFSFGSESYLGVFLEEVTAERVKELNLAEERGAVVMKVVEGSPAEKAGIKANDVIVSFNGRRVDTVREMQRLLSDLPAGRTVTFEVLRGGTSQTLSATLAKRSQGFNLSGRNDEMTKLFGNLQQSEAERERSRKLLEENFKQRQNQFGNLAPFSGNLGAYNFNFGSGFFRGSRMGVSVESMSEQLANYFGVKDGKGVLVTEVRDNSAAAKAGLKAGDVITEVDGQKVGDINDLMTSLSKKDEGTVVVKIIRKGEDKTVNVTLEKPAPTRTVPPRRQRAVVYAPFVNVV